MSPRRPQGSAHTPYRLCASAYPPLSIQASRGSLPPRKMTSRPDCICPAYFATVLAHACQAWVVSSFTHQAGGGSSHIADSRWAWLPEIPAYCYRQFEGSLQHAGYPSLPGVGVVFVQHELTTNPPVGLHGNSYRHLPIPSPRNIRSPPPELGTVKGRGISPLQNTYTVK